MIVHTLTALFKPLTPIDTNTSLRTPCDAQIPHLLQHLLHLLIQCSLSVR
jgi:hypothetical protein